ncbi:hypothetical protein KC19_3G045800 [Ceratodon purpureus]|uniref:Uncharacterized protein n=1 Tax=Ceratodon purpureus TaxID=3225 RepID=A0A8T0IH48_CERPU|nr:hypothetical protein KC19_3G045800 [Ceratodon purpureus]
MGQSKCDLSYAMPAANWDGAPRRPVAEVSGRALEGFPVTHLRPPPGAKPANLADLPFDNFEPPPELLKPSRNNLGGKILKLLKLRKKSSSAAPAVNLPMEDFHQPSLRVLHFQDLISHSTQFPSPVQVGFQVDDVTKRYNYDSDEHSGNYASDTQTSSSSMISSSSRNSNSSELESNRSSGTPRSPCLYSGQLTNSQLMANILISIMDEEDNASGSASDEHGSSEDDIPTMASLNGPHESAWHQPRDEMFNADSPTVRGRQSTSMKHLSSSGHHTPKAGTRTSVAVNGLTSPGPSRRFGKLDLSRIEVHKFR